MPKIFGTTARGLPSLIVARREYEELWSHLNFVVSNQTKGVALSCIYHKSIIISAGSKLIYLLIIKTQTCVIKFQKQLWPGLNTFEWVMNLNYNPRYIAQHFKNEKLVETVSKSETNYAAGQYF